MRALGLMSGTSLDGIDVAVVRIAPSGLRYAVELERFGTVPFVGTMRERLLAALPPNAPTPAELSGLDRDLGRAFALAAREVADGRRVAYAATHGLTAHHRGKRRETMQIGDPYYLRDALEATVAFDFRRADCAVDGEGAPLVPYVDAMLFASATDDVVALNLGGIANVTVLRRGADPARATAWDTGPANMLLDAFVRERTSGELAYDRDGAFALAGVANERVVRELAAREAFFLMLPPPKSTGRERFGAQLLAAHGDLFGPLSLEDGCATLVAFSAATLAESLIDYGPAGGRVIASGGGVENPALVRAIRERLAPAGFVVERSDAYGVDPAAKEAIAFAILGYETLRGRPANLPGATGAARPVVLGAIAPYALADVLAKIRDEVAANGTA